MEAEFETAREAIDEGLKLFHSGAFEESINVFKASLDLPGTGVRRFKSETAFDFGFYV